MKTDNTQIRILHNIIFSNMFSHLFFERGYFYCPCIDIYDIHMEGIDPRFDFITKNGKLFVIYFLTFILHFIE